MEPILYLSPEELKQRVSSERRKLRRLLVKMQQTDRRLLDERVHDLHHQAFSQFSCLDCGNCCRSLGPRLTPADIERMARFLKIRVADVYQNYLAADEDGDTVFASMPCPFLGSDNHCSIYSHRPSACREYPHTDRKKFYQIAELSLKNCETCPVVYGIFTALANELPA